jgi:hypothetical protein
VIDLSWRDCLLAILANASADDLRAALARLPPSEELRLVRESHVLGVGSLVHRSLQQAGLIDRLPEAAAKELDASFFQTAAANMLRLDNLGRVLDTLSAQGIQVIVLKGAYLATAVYQDPASRPMSDVDLLARRGDLVRVARILDGLGYVFERPVDVERDCAASQHLPCCFRPPFHRIEVHWNIETPNFPYTIDLEGLWHRARPFRLNGREALSLAPEDSILMTCMHCVRHQFDFYVLRSLCDLQAICRRSAEEIDWARVVDRAKQWQTRAAVYLVLSLAVGSLNVPVPSDALRDLAPTGLDQELLNLLDEELWGGDPYAAGPVGANMAILLTQGTLRSRATLLWERLFPPREEIAASYGVPATKGARLYACYANRLTSLVRRYLRRILTGDLMNRRAIEEISLIGKRRRTRKIINALIHGDRARPTA